LETWFLLAKNLCVLKKYESAQECLKNIDLLVGKFKLKEPELLKYIEDVRRTVKNGLTPNSGDV